jgi:hypothetical protein
MLEALIAPAIIGAVISVCAPRYLRWEERRQPKIMTWRHEKPWLVGATAGVCAFIMGLLVSGPFVVLGRNLTLARAVVFFGVFGLGVFLLTGTFNALKRR